VAIKGKTKRSQGRPVRRPAPGPRIQAFERREKWYRATAFPVTLAVIALLGTLIAAANRVQEGWARDDVRRFTDQVRTPLARMPDIVGAGTTAKPGFASAGELAGGKLKPADLAKRAKDWQTQLSDVRAKASNVSLGPAPQGGELNGNPPDATGGHVPMLSSVRDAYAAAVGTYFEAAHTYELAAAAPAKSQLAQQLVSQGDQTAKRGEQAMDAAAGMLARLTARYDLDVTRQMPGESAESYAKRYAGAPTPAQTPVGN
jgi:hypothetical protein